MRAAVVGHVEWIEFLPVERVPQPGEIVGTLDPWEEAGGGGSVAAIQLSLLADSVLFFTALSTDELGTSARAWSSPSVGWRCTPPSWRRRSAAGSRTSTRRASARSRPSGRRSGHAGTTARFPGTSSRVATPCTSARETSTRSSRRGVARVLCATARELGNAQARLDRARRTRGEREGRRRRCTGRATSTRSRSSS